MASRSRCAAPVSISSSLLLFWGSIALGYLARRARFVTTTFAPTTIRLLAASVAPPVAMLSMWIVDLKHLTLMGLPFIGVTVSVLSLLPAWWLARRWQLNGPQRGSWLVGAFFSNVGFLGALVAFAVWGESAYGLCTLYFLFFGLTVYTVGYGIGERYGHLTTDEQRPSQLELWRWTPMVGTLAGLGLSWFEVSRPSFLGPINRALIPVLTGTYLFIVGTTLHVGRVGRYVREGLWMCAIKLLYAPLVGAGLAWLLGYHHAPDALAFRVVVLEAATPTAITSLTLPALFGLDQDFANSLWVITTLASMAVIPLLLWLL